MIIRSNITALNTSNRLGFNSKNKSASLEKLSSGLRINKAADDAAGLSISEKMKGQIRGLNMAAKNTQDGISLIQTADGALNEVHAILQRGRELSVQACNGVLTDSDREAIDAEIKQLTNEVDRIANTTEFNTKKILNVKSSDPVAEAVLKGLKSGWLEASASRIDATYGLQLKHDFAIIFEQGALGGVLADANGNRIRIELSDFAPGTGASGDNPYPVYDDRILAHELTHAIMYQNGINTTTVPLWFMEGTAEGIAGADERLQGDLTSGAAAIVGQMATPVTNSSAFYSMSYTAVRYMDASIKLNGGNGIIDIMNYLEANSGASLDAALSNEATHTFAGEADFKSKYTTDGEAFINGTLAGYGSYDIDLSNTDVGALGGADAGGSLLTKDTVVDESTATDTTDGQPLTAYGITVTWPDLPGPTDPFTLQIGANCGQHITIDLPSVTASDLGLSELDILKKADKAIDIYDSAIGAVSTYRSKLGALQNRLEHTLNNLSNAEENLTSAESRIRDTDMAKEMTEFTKQKILEQATMSMLSQANSQPQSVLSLLAS